MKYIARFTIVIGLLPFIAKAQGAKVEFVLTSGTVVSGELVEIGDTTLTVAARNPTDDSIMDRSIPLRSIERYTVRKKSNLGSTVLTYFGIGACSGALIGIASGDDPPGFMSLSAGQKAGFLAVVLGGLGATVGLISGIASSRPAAVITPLPGDTFDALRPYTRVARATRR